MSQNHTDAETLLREWLDIQQQITAADKDMRATSQKSKSAPNRRVRKTIREVRRMLQALSKKLIAFDRACVVGRKESKKAKKGA